VQKGTKAVYNEMSFHSPSKFFKRYKGKAKIPLNNAYILYNKGQE
jgi:hypothetical protein